MYIFLNMLHDFNVRHTGLKYFQISARPNFEALSQPICSKNMESERATPVGFWLQI